MPLCPYDTRAYALNFQLLDAQDIVRSIVPTVYIALPAFLSMRFVFACLVFASRATAPMLADTTAAIITNVLVPML